MFLLLFVVHNCRNEEINVNKSDFFYKHFLICNPKFCINQAIKVTKMTFFDFFDFLMFLLIFVVHNCRNEEIYITKSDLFYKHLFICNPKLCINQAINVTKSAFFYF